MLRSLKEARGQGWAGKEVKLGGIEGLVKLGTVQGLKV